MAPGHPAPLHLVLVLALAVCTGCAEREPDTGTIAGASADSDATGGFQRVLAPRLLRFPEDHGAHPEFRQEWWYVTGNLDGEGGRRFGFQVTFFRYGLTAKPAQRQSRWAADQVYLAHFALTDVATGRFRAYERRARGALGLAGARLSPFKVWLEDWRLEAAAGNDFPWRIAVQEGDQALHLSLRSEKPMVPQGDAGFSRKSAEPGNASYYYSGTRLAAEGSVQTADGTFPVHGLAWLDREWSTSALAPDQAGWDWFALQLADGSELMYYRLRRKDGSDDPHSAGSWIDRNGGKTPLGAHDVTLRVLDQWRAPGGGHYPARWRLDIVPQGKRLLIRPVLADQELRGGILRYWEGAVDVLSADHPEISLGRGYLEMTGYAEAAGTPAAGR